MNKYLIIMVLVFSGIGVVNSATILGNEFSYQGELKDSSDNPLTGNYDFQFVLFEEAAATNQVPGANITVENVVVTNGIFTTLIDFGTDKFLGNNTWMQIHVRVNGSGDGYTPLTPLQQIVSTPYAIHSQTSELATTVATDAVSGSEIINNSVASSDIQDGTITSIDMQNSAVTIGKLAANSVDSGKIVDESIAKVDIGIDAVGTSEIITSEVQRRAVGTCEFGSYLIGINEDGSVICEILPISTEKEIHDIVNGQVYKIIQRPTGFPMILFKESSTNLNVFDCTNETCTDGTSRLIATSFANPDIAIKIDGTPIISFVNSGMLKVANCVDSGCTSNLISIVDSNNDNTRTSIDTRSIGNPVIVYTTNSNAIKVANCNNVSCSNPSTISILLSLNGVVNEILNLKVLIRANNNPFILYSYFAVNGFVENGLSQINCSDFVCASFVGSTIDIILNGLSSHSNASLSLDNTGKPVIGFDFNDNGSFINRIILCINVACTSSSSNDTDIVTTGNLLSSISTQPSGFPVIAYLSTNNKLKAYVCDDSLCTTGNKQTLSINSPSSISLIKGSTGKPIISYSTSGANGKIIVYNCIDSECIK